MFIARMMKNYKLQATLAKDLASKTKELKASGDVLEGELARAQGACSPSAGTAPTGRRSSNAKGSTNIWLKEGSVSKMEYRVQGTISFNGQDREHRARTTTIEIKERRRRPR